MWNRKRENRSDTGKRRQRQRIRGQFSTGTRRTIGLTSLAAPVIGYVVNDLRKPDSMVRRLVGQVIHRLAPPEPQPREVLDITDEVEIVESRKRTTGSEEQRLKGDQNARNE
jgi:hypothetical protein